MIVVHGAWITGTAPAAGGFALWGECLPPAATPVNDSPGAEPRVHPFAASCADLSTVLAALTSQPPPTTPIEAWVWLPAAGARPSASTDERADPPPDTGDPLPWRTPVLMLDPAQAVALLLVLPAAVPPDGAALGDDLHVWAEAARWALGMAGRERFLPGLQHGGEGHEARWKLLLDDPVDLSVLDAIVRALPPAGHAVTCSPESPPPAAWPAVTEFAQAAVDAVARAALRAGGGLPARATGNRSVGRRWLDALRDDPAIPASDAEIDPFCEGLGAWEAIGEPDAAAASPIRLLLRLEPPEGGETWLLRPFLQFKDDLSLLVSADEVWQMDADEGVVGNQVLEAPHDWLLAALGHAARFVPAVDAALRDPAPSVCELSPAEAFAFLREQAPAVARAGVGVLLPQLGAGVVLRARLGGRGASSSGRGPGVFGWDSLVEFDWQAAIGDTPLTPEEFESLVRAKEPLVQVRGQWVELSAETLERALALVQRARKQPGLSMAEALRYALAPDPDNGLGVDEVEISGGFADLLTGIQTATREATDGEPEGFHGELRPYQRVGLSWLATLARSGLGACLADDMGLGKTVQLIALLLHRRAAEPEQRAPALLICPTSVVSNWVHELRRFAPSLRALVHHGAGRDKKNFAAEAATHDLVISTYALLHRDAALLRTVEWNEIILDEAQNIKNPATKAAQSARSLRCRFRTALTGTPVENRLTDLWSIFQFLNPGLLGSERDFQARFARRIERDHDQATAERLQRLVRPFVLRRLKSDPAVIADLPEKNEMKVYCSLTSEQASLYQAVLREQMEGIDQAAGIERRGRVLATLTKLKQVCNHPALFLKDGSRLDGRSGKLTRLTEMLEEVVAADDRALVFTQYAEMGRLLQPHLREALGREVLFLHGGTPRPRREQMIDQFQQADGPHIFVLSLKAGGTGLNLTRAAHVFHFDRWWNPAVENQATDRAYRIGQERNVQVHKLLCGGTFEEKLDELIERKLALADAIVGQGEQWITELSTDELRALFALDREPVEV